MNGIEPREPVYAWGQRVIALDDLASELDRTHQARVLERLLNGPAQIFITATETPAALLDLTHIARFHVEHAQIVAVP